MEQEIGRIDCGAGDRKKQTVEQEKDVEAAGTI